MFSTCQSLQKRTPANGIGREEYIKLLSDEYFETSDIGKMNPLNPFQFHENES